MHQGRVADGAEDGLHAVVHRQHEAGGQLLQLAPRVHERGGVGQELEARHDGEELVDDRVERLVRMVSPVRLGDVLGHPDEHVGRRLERHALGGALEVALLEHRLGAGRQSLVQLVHEMSKLADSHLIPSFASSSNSFLNPSMLSYWRYTEANRMYATRSID